MYGKNVFCILVFVWYCIIFVYFFCFRVLSAINVKNMFLFSFVAFNVVTGWLLAGGCLMAAQLNNQNIPNE